MSPEYYIKSTHHSPRNHEEGAIKPWQLAESEATTNILNTKENCKKATALRLDARISADQGRRAHSPESTSRRVALTIRLISASVLSIAFRCHGRFGCPLVSSLIPGASFFAAPRYHTSSCIRASMPNCRGPIRFLAPPSDFGAHLPFVVDKFETYHIPILCGR